MSNYYEGSSASKLIDGLRVESAEIGIINGDSDVFEVSGLVYLHSIVGRVTTTIGAVACTMRLRHNSDAAAASNLSADHANIANHVADEVFYTITGTVGNLTVSSDALLNEQAAGFILPSGTIEMTTDAAQDGGITWIAFYTPITDGASISAA